MYIVKKTSHHSQVNEEGTEAAAAAATPMASFGSDMHTTYCGYYFWGSDEEKPKFMADHPFAYMLVLNSGKGSTMLFNGAYSGFNREGTE
jgi:serine protease inhibitor